MRALMIGFWLLAIPLAARASPAFPLQAGGVTWAEAGRLGGGGAGEPLAHLAVPRLSLEPDLAPLMLGASEGSLTGGMTSSERQALAFILGILPGFGLGHVIAGSPSWPIWLAVDAVLLVVVGFAFWWGPAWHGVESLGVLAFLVERGFEGYFAYQAAGGRPIASPGALPEDRGLALLAADTTRSWGLALAF